jgi:predicted metal-dependent phosphoesterase TrpH
MASNFPFPFIFSTISLLPTRTKIIPLTQDSDLLRALKKVRPDHKFIDEFSDENVRDVSKVANERAEELLKAMGRPGWTSLEDSLKANVEGL